MTLLPLSSLWITSQILSALSFLFIAWSFQNRNRRDVLRVMFVGAFLNGLHFICLQKLSAAGNIFIIMVAMSLAQRDIKNRLSLQLSFAAVFALMTAITFMGVSSLLSFLASVLSTTGMFTPTERKMRFILLFATSTWIIHNAYIFSPIATLKEGVILLSSIVGFVRLDIGRDKTI